MYSSMQTLVLALTALAVGGVEGHIKSKKRADPVDISNAEGVQNILVTNADQNRFYIPMEFGSGNGAVDIYGLVSTTR